jgi:AmmeMemoRadiSam system protein B
MKRIVIVLFLCLMVSVGIFLSVVANQAKLPDRFNGSSFSTSTASLQASFDPRSFYSALHSVSDTPQDNATFIKGGIIPHHLAASHLIADFFKRLKTQNPKTILLIGPNHQNSGNTPIITSNENWSTPLGMVKVNHEMISRINQLDFISHDPEVMRHEHSVTGIVPFIAYYLPETTVTPLILSSTLTTTQLNELIQIIKEQLADPKVVIVAAVDFSHYQTIDKAETYDRETEKALKEFAISEILSYGNEHTDSPMSIAVLLQSLQQLGYQNLTILNNTNSGRLSASEGPEVTSYFEVIIHD